VRVNGDDITVLQLNNELQRANVQAAQQDEAGKQIVSALVDRQILMQEAHKNKLDRNPRVMQALENSKAQILAQAYLEDKVSSLAKPTDAEISDYRAKHADIFANRKVYLMEEVAFKVEADNVQAVQSLSGTAKTLEDVTRWLDAHQVKYARNRAPHAAETVPAQLLEKLSKMAVGELIFINANGNAVAGRMLEIKDAAISEKDSKPLIERMIFGQKRKQVAEAEMKRLRSAAKIEYINKKFDPTAVSSAATPVATTPTAKPAESVKAGEKAKPVSNDKVESHIEKGLSGL
jgi:EpsD family peptidyl-prolyl cis-trans isomerase